MTKLNQIIAVANGKKNEVQRNITDLYKQVQKPELFNGLSRHYQPLDDEGETLPPENKRVQLKVNDVINDASSQWTELFDIVATQDWANTEARADVVVDGVVILQQVPVTYMLFLEKQLNDVKSFISRLPELDPNDEWHFDDNANVNVSDVQRTNKTKKNLRVVELSPATEQHPAQVTTVNEDVKVGEWSTIKQSGAVSAKEKAAKIDRVNSLLEAVKFAREEANNSTVDDVSIGKPVFDFLFTSKD